MLAVMAARGDTRIASATFFATMVDFADPGELAVFIDEDQIAALEARMNEKGYLEGHDMASSFSMLRANDLIWSFVVNNYLLGKEPFPFDLLYWNSDSTRMPAAMHSFYLRKMYLENKLVEPGALEIAGVPIDLGSIEAPSYVVAAREDHIAPWRSAYAPARLFGGPVRFVLSASGHIAGIINHPDAGKYCYWTKAKTAKTPEAWLKGRRPPRRFVVARLGQMGEAPPPGARTSPPASPARAPSRPWPTPPAPMSRRAPTKRPTTVIDRTRGNRNIPPRR